MLIYEDVEKVITKKEVKTIICNCCGITFDIPKNGFDNSDITSVDVIFGYGSKFDTEQWEFDLCDDCVEKITDSFKHKPLKINCEF